MNGAPKYLFDFMQRKMQRKRFQIQEKPFK